MRYLSEETMQRIIAFVNTYYSENGYSPTISEIARRLSLAVGTVHKYLHRMTAMEQLSFDGRHIVTPYIEEMQNRFDAPICGDIACGAPIYAVEQHDSMLPIPDALIGKGEYFWLRAQGESMINAGIENGDFVLIRRQNTAMEGEIVAALIDDSATLKTFTLDQKQKKIVLRAENDDKSRYPDQIYDDIVIQGVANYVLKRL